MKIISLLLLFATTAILSHGQDYRKVANPTECRNTLQAQHNSTSSLSAVFTERIYSSMYESSKKSNGKLLYKRSQKIRWEIVSPRKQVILINGNSIRMNEEGKEVASNSSGAVAKKIQKMMINLISGDFLNEKEYKILCSCDFDNETYHCDGFILSCPKNLNEIKPFYIGNRSESYIFSDQELNEFLK